MKEERFGRSETLTQRASVELNASGGIITRVRPGGSTIVRALKVAVLLAGSAIVLLVSSSSLTQPADAAGATSNIGATGNPTFSEPQGKNKFQHSTHSQLRCDQCHIRRADAIKPVIPSHGACIACHIKEFTSTQFGICANCHEGIKAVRPAVQPFPERQTFGVVFSHKTHTTYISGEKRADCAACHTVAGTRATYPGHRECYVCHKAPDQVKAGEKVGGASCGECHTTAGDKNPPSVMSRAYNFRFSHDAHVGRAQCAECHSVVLGGGSAQVSLPQLKEHGGGFAKSCGSCHNGARAFTGEQGNGCSCNRCHSQRDITHSCM